ncbi:MAG: hypothetical protein ACYCTB_10050 [bacterium]
MNKKKAQTKMINIIKENPWIENYLRMSQDLFFLIFIVSFVFFVIFYIFSINLYVLPVLSVFTFFIFLYIRKNLKLLILIKKEIARQTHAKSKN